MGNLFDYQLSLITNPLSNDRRSDKDDKIKIQIRKNKINEEYGNIIKIKSNWKSEKIIWIIAKKMCTKKCYKRTHRKRRRCTNMCKIRMCSKCDGNKKEPWSFVDGMWTKYINRFFQFLSDGRSPIDVTNAFNDDFFFKLCLHIYIYIWTQTVHIFAHMVNFFILQMCSAGELKGFNCAQVHKIK